MPNGRDRDNVVPFRRPPPPDGGGRRWRPPAWLVQLLTRTATGWIILVNAAIWIVMVALARGHGILDEFPNGVTDRLGAMVPALVPGEPWRLVTSMFLHANLLHIGMNMAVLGWCGPRTEAAFGKGRYLMLYLGAGVAAELASFGWESLTSASPSVGASGAILGVLGALFALAWKAEGWRAQTTQMWFRFSILGIGFGIVMSFLGQIQMDNAAHVGGFLAGTGIGWLIAGRRPWPVTLDRTAIALLAAVVGACFGLTLAIVRPEPPIPPELAAAKAAYDSGDWPAADHALEEAIRLHPDDGALVASHGYVLQQLGKKDAAIAEYEKALALHPGADSLGEIAVGLDELGEDATARKAAYEAKLKDPSNPRWEQLYEAIKQKSGG